MAGWAIRMQPRSKVFTYFTWLERINAIYEFVGFFFRRTFNLTMCMHCTAFFEIVAQILQTSVYCGSIIFVSFPIISI